MSDSRRRTPSSLAGLSNAPDSLSRLRRVAAQRSAMAADDSSSLSASKRATLPEEVENVSPSPSFRARRQRTALAYYEDLVENHSPRTILGRLPINSVENPFDGSGRKLSKLALADAESKAKTPGLSDNAGSTPMAVSDSLASIPSWREGDTTGKSANERALKRRGMGLVRQSAEDASFNSKILSSLSSWHEVDSTPDVTRGQKKRVLKRRKTVVTQNAGAIDFEDEAESLASVSSWSEVDTGASQRERLLTRRKTHGQQRTEGEVDDADLVADDGALASVSSWRESDSANDEDRVLKRRRKVRAKQFEAVECTSSKSHSSGSVASSWADRDNTNMTFHPNIESTRLVASNSPMPDDVLRSARKRLSSSTPVRCAVRGGSEAILPLTPEVEAQKSTVQERTGVGSQCTPLTGRSQASLQQTPQRRSSSRLQHSSQADNSRLLPDDTPLARRSRASLQLTPIQISNVGYSRSESRELPVKRTQQTPGRPRSLRLLSAEASKISNAAGAHPTENEAEQVSVGLFPGSGHEDIQVAGRVQRSRSCPPSPHSPSERLASLRQTPRPVTRHNQKSQLLMEQIERELASSDQVISGVLAGGGDFLRPRAIVKTKKPKAKKDRFRPTLRRMFTHQDTYFQFQKNSNVRLTARSKPALLEVSDRFCQKLVKYLEKSLLRADRTVLCLADVKHLMRDMGLLPDNDPKNVRLYKACYDLLDYEDRCRVIPFKRLDVVPGSTAIPENVWDDIPNEPTRRRRKMNQ